MSDIPAMSRLQLNVSITYEMGNLNNDKYINLWVTTLLFLFYLYVFISYVYLSYAASQYASVKFSKMTFLELYTFLHGLGKGGLSLCHYNIENVTYIHSEYLLKFCLTRKLKFSLPIKMRNFLSSGHHRMQFNGFQCVLFLQTMKM